MALHSQGLVGRRLYYAEGRVCPRSQAAKEVGWVRIRVGGKVESTMSCSKAFYGAPLLTEQSQIQQAFKPLLPF